MRKLISATAAAAVTFSALVAPAAEARHRDYWGHRHRVDVDAGDVIAGVLILGTIAAIANTGKKRERERQGERYEPRDSRDSRDGGYDRSADYDRDDDGQRSTDYGRDDRDLPIDRADEVSGDLQDNGDDRHGTSGRTDAGRAADACAVAAERRLGGNARTTGIDRVMSEGNGWSVSGRVESDAAGPRDFQCSYRAGRVSSVSIDA